MALANMLGSNVFDVLLGLGVPWLLAGIIGKPVVFVKAFEHIRWLVLILFLVTAGLNISLYMNKWMLTRRIGLGLCACYALFVVYVIVITELEVHRVISE